MKKNCTFCNCKDSVENQIIESKNGAICKSCAETTLYLMMLSPGLDMVKGYKPKEEIKKTPKDFKSILDDYVIGQDDAKKVLSVAVYNHIKRIENLDKKIDKSNVLYVGPTGVGKTHLVQTLAKYLDIPLAIADATSLTAAGYVGEDVENVVTKLFNAADQDIEKTENGIIFIDEIDKIAKMGEGRSVSRDVSGEAVQQALLKIIEGSKINIPVKGGRKHPSGKDQVEIDTSNILFICGGSFPGLKEKSGKISIKGLGQGVQEEESATRVEASDLIKFGIIPELMGRLHLISELHEISEEGMIEILTKPKDSVIKQYVELFKLDDVDLKFSKSSLKEIAKIAMKRKTGARALRSVVENIMIDIMFDIADYRGKIVNVVHDKNGFSQKITEKKIKDSDKEAI